MLKQLGMCNLSPPDLRSERNVRNCEDEIIKGSDNAQAGKARKWLEVYELRTTRDIKVTIHRCRDSTGRVCTTL